MRNDDGRGAKCLLSVARADRELTDGELQAVEAFLAQLTTRLGSHAGLLHIVRGIQPPTDFRA